VGVGVEGRLVPVGIGVADGPPGVCVGNGVFVVVGVGVLLGVDVRLFVGVPVEVATNVRVEVGVFEATDVLV
jgi:hypothetical protein